MKTQLPRRVAAVTVFVVILFALFPIARAAENEARVTVVVHDVRLLSPHTTPRPAALNEDVRSGIAVKTGAESRAELTFANATITRLGSETLFSFSEEARRVDLDSGAILLHVPKSAGAIKINMPVATVAVTGFTALFSTGHHTYSKIIIVEGKACVWHRGAKSGERCVKLFPGDEFIIRPDGSFPSEAVHINLAKIINGPLFTNFSPLPGRNLITAAVQNQQNNPPPGGMTDLTNQDALDQNIAARPTGAHPRHPTPTPPKVTSKPIPAPTSIPSPPPKPISTPPSPAGPTH